MASKEGNMAIRRKWMTVAEAAWSLGISANTVRSAIYHDRLLADKIGAHYTIMCHEVERYRREHLGKHGWDERKAKQQEKIHARRVRAADDKAHGWVKDDTSN